jgi:looped-hinge helix DNA binding domain, AbrB family
MLLMVLLLETMVQLRLKVGPKGQVLIPKVLRERYGIKEGGTVIAELRPEGILLRGSPSPQEALEYLRQREEKLRALGVREPQPRELAALSLEEEFDESVR